MSEKPDFVPYGPEWEKEMMKLPKPMLIKFFKDAKAENQRLREALQGILEIGKRDMSNPKYDPYFEAAKQALKP